MVALRVCRPVCKRRLSRPWNRARSGMGPPPHKRSHARARAELAPTWWRMAPKQLIPLPGRLAPVRRRRAHYPRRPNGPFGSLKAASVQEAPIVTPASLRQESRKSRRFVGDQRAWPS